MLVCNIPKFIIFSFHADKVFISPQIFYNTPIVITPFAFWAFNGYRMGSWVLQNNDSPLRCLYCIAGSERFLIDTSSIHQTNTSFLFTSSYFCYIQVWYSWNLTIKRSLPVSCISTKLSNNCSWSGTTFLQIILSFNSGLVPIQFKVFFSNALTESRRTGRECVM